MQSRMEGRRNCRPRSAYTIFASRQKCGLIRGSKWMDRCSLHQEGDNLCLLPMLLSFLSSLLFLVQVGPHGIHSKNLTTANVIKALLITLNYERQDVNLQDFPPARTCNSHHRPRVASTATRRRLCDLGKEMHETIQSLRGPPPHAHYLEFIEGHRNPFHRTACHLISYVLLH